MTFSEKISALRKQKGWSQEELAEKLMVTRQAVSKWESAQSMPDLDKLVQLSEALGVSTDYLLKDEQAQSAPVPATAEQTVKPRHVTQEEAKRFLQLQMAAIPKTTLGVALCVWSPIALIGLPVLRSTLNWGFPEEICSGIGLCVLLVMVAAGVALLLTAGGTLREFECLEREPIETDNGAREQALHMQREMASFCTRQNTIGVVLCILSVLPLFALMCVPGVPDGYYSLAVCALLLLVGIACLLLVRTGSMRGAVDKLLEQGDYTRENKAKSRFVGAVSAAYWLVVTAAFLFYTFGPNGNGQPQYSWFIWAIAGVLYGALMAALSVYRKKSK
ncbi:MAG: helix-turn-helix transcriptional regulator [Oscillospiraceae bacterium]|nr:helix-turn-helix transcriptional regulator [Oscillospiraceae bacterium]